MGRYGQRRTQTCVRTLGDAAGRGGAVDAALDEGLHLDLVGVTVPAATTRRERRSDLMNIPSSFHSDTWSLKRRQAAS